MAGSACTLGALKLGHPQLCLRPFRAPVEGPAAAPTRRMPPHPSKHRDPQSCRAPWHAGLLATSSGRDELLQDFTCAPERVQ